MKKIAAFLLTGIGVIIPLFIVYGEIFGIVHSVRHHSKNDVIASFLLPPWAWWRSVELYWHDDYANVDWNKRLKGDVFVLYRLLASDPKKDEQAEFNDILEKFSKRVNAYPKDKSDYLKESAKMYARFLQAVNTDFTIYFKEQFDGTEQSNDINWSKLSKPILDSIVKEYEIKELLDTYVEMDSKIKEISGLIFDQLNAENVEPEVFFKRLQKLISQDINKITRTYKMIFNEEIGIDFSSQLNTNES